MPQKKDTIHSIVCANLGDSFSKEREEERGEREEGRRQREEGREERGKRREGRGEGRA